MTRRPNLEKLILGGFLHFWLTAAKLSYSATLHTDAPSTCSSISASNTTAILNLIPNPALVHVDAMHLYVM
jgi:hypothetical protein